MSKLKFGLKLAFFYVIVPLLALILFEGLSSAILLVKQLINTKPLAERLHTRFDPDLGWVNVPNTSLPDFYGPGLHVHINAQGFRNDEDFGEERFINILCDGFGQLASTMLKEMLSDLRNFTEGGVQPEDITVLLAHFVAE